jgi:hypothetical protein
VVESGALLKRCTPKGYPGFESLPHRCFSLGTRFQSRVPSNSRVKLVCAHFRQYSLETTQIGTNLAQAPPSLNHPSRPRSLYFPRQRPFWEPAGLGPWSLTRSSPSVECTASRNAMSDLSCCFVIGLTRGQSAFAVASPRLVSRQRPP